MSEVLSLHEKLRDGSIAPSCGIVYTSDIYSCPGHPLVPKRSTFWTRRRSKRQPLGSWCDLLPAYNSLKSVIWSLRSTHAREKCFQRKLGFHNSSPKVNIVWHVRTGDICLHCEAGFFTELFALLKGASPADTAQQVCLLKGGPPSVLTNATHMRLIWLVLRVAAASALCASPAVFRDHMNGWTLVDGRWGRPNESNMIELVAAPTTHIVRHPRPTSCGTTWWSRSAGRTY